MKCFFKYLMVFCVLLFLYSCKSEEVPQEDDYLPGVLPADVENDIKDYYLQKNLKNYPQATLDDIEILRYYGAYNNSYVLTMESRYIKSMDPSYSWFYFMDVGGIRFDTIDGTGIIVWHEGEIFSFKDAYTLNLLTNQNLNRIFVIHEKYIMGILRYQIQDVNFKSELTIFPSREAGILGLHLITTYQEFLDLPQANGLEYDESFFTSQGLIIYGREDFFRIEVSEDIDVGFDTINNLNVYIKYKDQLPLVREPTSTQYVIEFEKPKIIKGVEVHGVYFGEYNLEYGNLNRFNFAAAKHMLLYKPSVEILDIEVLIYFDQRKKEDTESFAEFNQRCIHEYQLNKIGSDITIENEKALIRILVSEVDFDLLESMQEENEDIKIRLQIHYWQYQISKRASIDELKTN